MAEVKFTTELPRLPEIPGVTMKHVAEWIGYAVGDDGSVWSCKNRGGQKSWMPWRQITPIMDVDGYPKVNLSKSKTGRRAVKVCVLVLETFVGPRPAGMECRHFPDRDRRNSRLSNLCWGTNSENKRDAVRDGTCALLRDDIRYNGCHRRKEKT